MAHHSVRAEGTFGSAFGGSVGCIFGIVFALVVLMIGGFLVCGGIIGGGCFAAKHAVDSVEDAARKAEDDARRKEELKKKADAEKPKEPEVKYPSIGEWVAGVDTRIRIDSAAVERPTLLVIGKGEQLGEEGLVIVFSAENGSKLKSLDYRRPVEGFTAVDSKKRALKLRTVRGVVVKGDVALKTLKPGEVVADILVFDPPAPDAVHVDIVFPSVGDWSKGGQMFRIPASVWK